MELVANASQETRVFLAEFDIVDPLLLFELEVVHEVVLLALKKLTKKFEND